MPIEKEIDDDGNIRITEVKLFEISAVTLAANEEAKILEVKGESAKIDYYTKRFDNLIKFIRKGNITDDLGYLVEYELEVLKSLIARDNTHQSTEELSRGNAHIEIEKDEDHSNSIINYMFNNLKSKSNE